MLRRLSALVLSLALIFGNSQVVNAQTILSKEVAEGYQLVPAEIRNELNKSGWKITTVESSTLNRRFGNGLKDGQNVAGTTIYDEKTIYITDKDSLAREAITHEMGHFVDYDYNTYYGYLPSQTEMFFYIFSTEAESEIIEEYCSESEVEYFAQAFKLYCEAPNDLYANCPMTHAYIEEILADLNNAYSNGIVQEYIPETYEIVRAW